MITRQQQQSSYDARVRPRSPPLSLIGKRPHAIGARWRGPSAADSFGPDLRRPLVFVSWFLKVEAGGEASLVLPACLPAFLPCTRLASSLDAIPMTTFSSSVYRLGLISSSRLEVWIGVLRAYWKPQGMLSKASEQLERAFGVCTCDRNCQTKTKVLGCSITCNFRWAMAPTGKEMNSMNRSHHHA